MSPGCWCVDNFISCVIGLVRLYRSWIVSWLWSMSRLSIIGMALHPIVLNSAAGAVAQVVHHWCNRSDSWNSMLTQRSWYCKHYGYEHLSVLVWTILIAVLRLPTVGFVKDSPRQVSSCSKADLLLAQYLQMLCQTSFLSPSKNFILR